MIKQSLSSIKGENILKCSSWDGWGLFCYFQLGIVSVDKYYFLLEWDWIQLNDISIFIFMRTEKPLHK